MSAMGSDVTPAVVRLAITSSTSSRRGCGPRRQASGSRCGTCRTSSCTRGAGRRAGSGCGTGPGTWASASSARSLTSSPNLLTSSHPAKAAPSRGPREPKRSLSPPERHAQLQQQRAALVVRLRGGHDRHLEAAQLVDLVVVDLGEDDLLAQPERVVAAAVEPVGADPPEVTDARQGDGDQLLQEVPHPAAAQGGPDADGHAGAELEGRHRLARLDHDLLLAGDRA